MTGMVVVGILSFVAGAVLAALYFGARTARVRAEVTGSVAAERAVLEERLLAKSQRLEEIQKQLQDAMVRADERVREAEALKAEKAVLEQRVEAGARALEETRVHLHESFAQASQEALRRNNEQFLQLAQERLEALQTSARGDLAQRQEAIAALLEPLKGQMAQAQLSLQQAEAMRSASLEGVRKEVESLGQKTQVLAGETERFRAVLKSSQARGSWGEETLRNVIERAGMSPHCDFAEQEHRDGSQPDLLVNLPGGRRVIVDAKSPDFEFLARLDGADDSKRAEILKAHAAKVKETAKALVAKDYPSAYPGALDIVIAFVPAESIFSTALEGDPDLIGWGNSQGVAFATPATLIPMLKAISLSWQQHTQAENARTILEQARELYERVANFFSHFGEVGEGLRRAVESYNGAVGSYERRLRPSGQKLEALGLKLQGKELGGLEPVEESPRALPPEEGNP